jgi:hypothetical protein
MSDDIEKEALRLTWRKTNEALTAARQRIAELEKERDEAREWSEFWRRGEVAWQEWAEKLTGKPQGGLHGDSTARDIIAARLASPLGSGAPAPVPTVCASWCGTPQPPWFHRAFCTPACQDPCRPLHPATPGER